MNTRKGRWWGAAGLVVLVTAILSYLGIIETPLTPEDNPPPPSGACAAHDAKKFAVGAALGNLGFTAADLRWEDQGFDLSLPGANQRGNGSFSNETITTPAQLVAFLQKDTPESKALLAEILKGIPPELHGKVLDPNFWIGVQFTTDVAYKGNTLYQNGTVKSAGDTHREVGDIWFFFVDDDCTVYTNVAVRAGCANLQLAPPVPVRPGSPPPPQPGKPGKPSKPTKPTPTTQPPTTGPPTTGPPPPTTAPCPPRYHREGTKCVKDEQGINQPGQPSPTTPPVNPDVNVGPTPSAPPEPPCAAGTTRVNGNCIGTLAPPLFVPPPAVEPPLAGDPPSVTTPPPNPGSI